MIALGPVICAVGVAFAVEDGRPWLIAFAGCCLLISLILAGDS